jgi:hypothetical protein
MKKEKARLILFGKITPEFLPASELLVGLALVKAFPDGVIHQVDR